MAPLENDEEGDAAELERLAPVLPLALALVALEALLLVTDMADDDADDAPDDMLIEPDEVIEAEVAVESPGVVETPCCLPSETAAAWTAWHEVVDEVSSVLTQLYALRVVSSTARRSRRDKDLQDGTKVAWGIVLACRLVTSVQAPPFELVCVALTDVGKVVSLGVVVDGKSEALSGRTGGNGLDARIELARRRARGVQVTVGLYDAVNALEEREDDRVGRIGIRDLSPGGGRRRWVNFLVKEASEARGPTSTGQSRVQADRSTDLCLRRPVTVSMSAWC